MYFSITKFILLSDEHDTEELRALETKANAVKTMWKKKTTGKSSFKG